MKHKGIDYKTSAVQYYLNNNESMDKVCKIFNCKKTTLKVNYQNNVFFVNNSVHDSEVAPLYGVGVLFDLPLGITLKAAYDYQQFNMRYAESGSKIKTRLGVARIGVIYNF